MLSFCAVVKHEFLYNCFNVLILNVIKMFKSKRFALSIFWRDWQGSLSYFAFCGCQERSSLYTYLTAKLLLNEKNYVCISGNARQQW